MIGKTFSVFTVSIILILFTFEPGICGKQFATTYKELALSSSELPKVIASHPRLYLRSEKWSHGPSVADLKEWAKVQPLKGFLQKKPAWNKNQLGGWAFRYMITGEEELVPPIVQELIKKINYWPQSLTRLAIAYDWIYNSPSISEEDRTRIEDKIVNWAKKAIVHGQRYQDMWSHYGYGPVTDLTAAGLVLYGHRPEAKEFLAMAGGYLKNFMRGWELSGGVWQGGWAYYAQGPANLIKMIVMWSTATDENLYEIIEQEQGDWLRKHLHFILSSRYPRGEPMDTGGFSYASSIKGSFGTKLYLTYAYNDPSGIYALRSLEKVPWWGGVSQYIFYPPQMWGKGDKDALPLTQIWGKDGIGYVQMRSGRDKDDTIIDFKSGDYFWSHQFQNQNSFTIYKKGRLVLQSGMYEKYYGRHVLAYYRPTVSSNTILVLQPGETSWVPPHVAKSSKISHENGYFKNWGGQRVNYMLPDLGSAETCFSFDKYLYRKNNDHHFETGRIEAFEIGPDYSYVYGDATDAYNNPRFSYPGNSAKIDLFTREMLFLDKKYLVVFDKVSSLDPSYKKIWLLHTVGKPAFENSPENIEIEGHIETFSAGTFRVDLPDSSLLGRTLFSEEYTVRRIGGGAILKEIKSDPANKGDAALTPEIVGKFRPVSTTIATDYALTDSWVLEFIEDDVYTVTGKRTGLDGQGNYKSPNSKDFLSKSRSLFIPAKNWQGKPHKGDKFYFTVDSPSYRFWVDGENYPPNPRKLYGVIKDGSKIHPGNWRIEVSPKESAKFNTFFHVLLPTDVQAAKLPVIDEILSDSGLLKGMVVDKWAILFAAKRSVLVQDVYIIKRKGMLRHRLFGLNKGTNLKVSITGLKDGEAKSIELTVSGEGTLSFEAKCPCRVELSSFL